MFQHDLTHFHVLMWNTWEWHGMAEEWPFQDWVHGRSRTKMARQGFKGGWWLWESLRYFLLQFDSDLKAFASLGLRTTASSRKFRTLVRPGWLGLFAFFLPMVDWSRNQCSRSPEWRRFQELERSSFVSSDREGGLIASLLVLELRYDGGSEMKWAIFVIIPFLASEHDWHLEFLRWTWRYLEYSILLSKWDWGCQTASGSDRSDEAAKKTHAFPLAKPSAIRHRRHG